MKLDRDGLFAGRSRRAYDEYRTSGVDFLRKVPAHWRVWKLPHAFGTIGSGTTPRADNLDYYDGDIPWVTTSELRETVITDTAKKLTELAIREHASLRVYPKGTVLFAMYGATIGRLGILGVPATVNQACCAFASPRALDSRFTFYWFLARRPILVANSSGGSQPNLSQDDLRQIRVPAPPLPEQRAIAAFLDRETAKIDALVEKKRRLIVLLKEKRAALISHAVTKGLNPDVPMKDSGIEWLGEIPEHWRATRLKHLVPDITVGIVVTPAKYYIDEGVPCLRSLNISGQVVSTNELVFISPESNELHAKSKICAGDIVIVRTGKTGTAAVVPEELDGANCIDLVIVRKSRLTSSQFLHYFINSPAAVRQVEALSVGSIQSHYNTATVGELWVPTPPVEEQDALTEFLDYHAGKIDGLILAVEGGIDRLLEYRTALISAAVTGKIDVRKEIS